MTAIANDAPQVRLTRRRRRPTLIAVSPRVRWALVLLGLVVLVLLIRACLLYTSPSPRDS